MECHIAPGKSDVNADSLCYDRYVQNSVHIFTLSTFLNCLVDCIREHSLNVSASHLACDWKSLDDVILISPSVLNGARGILSFLDRFFLDLLSQKTLVTSKASSSIHSETCNWLSSRSKSWNSWISNKTEVGLTPVNMLITLPFSGPDASLGNAVLQGIELGIDEYRGLISDDVVLNWKEFIVDHQSSTSNLRAEISPFVASDTFNIIFGPSDSNLVAQTQGPFSMYVVPTIDQGMYSSKFANKLIYPTLFQISPTLLQVFSYTSAMNFGLGWLKAHLILTESSLGLDALRLLDVTEAGQSVVFETKHTVPFVEKSDTRAKLRHYLKTVQRSESKVIYVTVTTALGRAIIEEASSMGMMNTQDFIWIGFDNWLSEKLTVGWSGYEKSINGMLCLSRFVNPEKFLSNGTEASSKKGKNNNETHFDVKLNENVNTGFGYDSAALFLTALNKTIRSLNNLGIPIDCLSPLHEGRTRVVDICRLDSSTVEEMKKEANCLDEFNATWCVKRDGLIHLLNSVEEQSLASLSNSPRLLLLYHLGNATFFGAGGRISFDSLYTKKESFGAAYNMINTESGLIQVKQFALLAENAMVITGGPVVFGGGKPVNPLTEVPSYLRVLPQPCEFLEKNGDSILVIFQLRSAAMPLELSFN